MERDMKAVREEFGLGGGVVGDISHCCKFINYYSQHCLQLVVIDMLLMIPLSHLPLQQVTCAGLQFESFKDFIY